MVIRRKKNRKSAKEAVSVSGKRNTKALDFSYSYLDNKCMLHKS